MRTQIGMRLPQLQPPPLERLGVPGRVMHKVVQRLPARTGYDRRQLDERLVVLPRQEQANEVLAQRRALLIAGEEVVALGAELVDRLGGGGGRFARGGHRSTSDRSWTPAGAPFRPASSVPDLTNQRLSNRG